MSRLNIKKIDSNLFKKICGNFDCGNLVINNFINSSMCLDQGFGITYVYLSDDNSELLGYFNISTGSVTDNNAQDYKIGGSIHINYFALSVKIQGIISCVTDEGTEIKISDIFLNDCIDIIENIRNNVGFSFITLSSTKQGYNLYKRACFEDLESEMHIADDGMEYQCYKMYLPLDIY